LNTHDTSGFQMRKSTKVGSGKVVAKTWILSISKLDDSFTPI
jgi:hypothetical protein